MQFGELLARLREGPEFRRVRDAREFALEAVAVFLAVTGMVQQAVDVMEDRPFVDLLILVMRAEFGQRPVGDVLAAVRA